MISNAGCIVCWKKCADIFGYILQILVFAALIAYIISLIKSIGANSSTWLGILIIVYVLYLICEFCSSMCSFLCHKTNENGIKYIMQNLVQTPPTIQLWCECYHYETRQVRVRASPPKKGGGKKSGGGAKKGAKSGSHSKVGGGGPHYKVRTETRKITTWEETVYFPYYSARDVSGLFQINNDRNAGMGKAFVKLEILPEINFADSLTYMDFENFRTHFYMRNRRKDQYMSYLETRAVPGLNPLNFVSITDNEPCGVNICMFILFTILPFAEFYKCYVNKYCLNQSFKIRKLISTRYDLNQDQYQAFVPSFDVPDQQYAFQSEQYNYINNDYQLQKPTAEEMNQAAQYQNMIPKYECVSYTSLNNGEIKVGVVQDLDSAYCSQNINDAPPPNCQDVYEQQAENNNMNMNMNMNSNYNLNADPNYPNNYNNGPDSNGNLMNNNIPMGGNMNQDDEYSSEVE